MTEEKIEIYEIDVDGIFTGKVQLIEVIYDITGNPLPYEVPEYFVEEKIPDGLFQPIKWTGTEWISTLTPVEVEQIMSNNQKPSVTNEELLRENQDLKSRLEAVEMATVTLMDFM